MSPARTIAINLDNPLRDMPGAVLLAPALCARGFRAVLVPVNILADGWSADPDLFLLNYHRPVNDYQVRRILDQGLPFAILDTEGAPYQLDH